jgi:hypothetical protein
MSTKTRKSSKKFKKNAKLDKIMEQRRVAKKDEKRGTCADLFLTNFHRNTKRNQSRRKRKSERRN